MPVDCYKQMSAIKEGVIMRLQCITIETKIEKMNTTAIFAKNLE